MITTHRKKATATFVLALACLVSAALPVWGEWHARLVKDTRPGAAGDSFQRFVTAGNLAYFISGTNFLQDYRLNRTDGTAAGTIELCPMGYYSSWADGGIATALATAGNRAVFVRNNAGTLQLWQSDGTVTGTTALTDLGDPYDPQNSPGNFVSSGSQVFFTRGPGLLYRSNGTASGTLLLKDLYAELGVANPTNVSSQFTRAFCVRNGLLYFLVGDAMDPQTAVWCSDGTPNGTRRVWQPGTDYYITGLWNTPDGLYAATTHDYFDEAVPKFVQARELWRILPESNSTRRVYYQEDVLNHYGAVALASLNGQVYFSIQDLQQLWKTGQGTDAIKVAEIPTPAGLAYKRSIWLLTATDKALVFAAQNDSAGYELWTSDGTAGGTHLLKDFNPGIQSSELTFLPFADGNLFVSAREGFSMNYPLWKTDGTDAGTVQAFQLPYAPSSANICEFIGGYLLLGSTPEFGMEPYFLYEGSFAITRQPISIGTAEVNSKARFTIGVSEWARPWTQYQWMLNGSPITDATAFELVIPAVQYANAGLYTCRVVYNDGSADTTLVSNPAWLDPVEKLPVLDAPIMACLALLLCLAAGVCVAQGATHRKERAGR